MVVVVVVAGVAGTAGALYDSQKSLGLREFVQGRGRGKGKTHEDVGAAFEKEKVQGKGVGSQVLILDGLVQR
jgi:hypothetical protein